MRPALNSLEGPLSPVVHQANHFARFFELREQFAHCSCLARQDQFRPDIGERLKYEFSQAHPRVRQLQAFVVDLAVAAVEQVNVNSARDVFRTIALAA
jgi:hypothetical protein